VKRLYCVIILIVLMLSIGCGGTKPKDVNAEIFRYGLAALETADEYLDGKIDIATARKQVGNAYDSISLAKNTAGSTSGADLMVSTNVLLLDTAMLNKELGNGTTDDILEARNYLAESLNEKNRK